MLLVDKQLGAEAKSYLYGHNTFVLVSLVPSVIRDMELSVFTVVSRRGLSAFGNHVLRIHLNVENKSATALTRTLLERPAARDWLLLMHEDLSHLCEIIQLFNHNQASNQVFILSPPDVQPIQWMEAGIPHKSTHLMLVEVHDTPYLRHDLSRNDKLERQKQLLAPLGLMANSFQSVNIKGGDHGVARDVVDRTTSRLVWPEAIGWDLYRMLRRQSSRLDALVRTGNWDLTHMGLAYAHLAQKVSDYTTLMNTVHCETFLFFWKLPTDPLALSKCHQVAVTTVIMECFLEAAGICLQEEKMDRFMFCITSAIIYLGDEQASSRAFKQALPPHLLSLLLHSHAVLHAVRGRYIPTRDGLETALGICPPNDVVSVKHDLDMLAAFRSSHFQSTPLTLATSALGQRFKNFFTTAFDPTFPNAIIPDRYRGWVDTQHQVPPHSIRSLEYLVDLRIAAAGRD